MSYLKTGWLPVIVTVIYYGTFIISRMIFYGVLLLIARGWGITKDHLGKHKWFVIGKINNKLFCVKIPQIV
jgi:hypothetical protein